MMPRSSSSLCSSSGSSNMRRGPLPPHPIPRLPTFCPGTMGKFHTLDYMQWASDSPTRLSLSSFALRRGLLRGPILLCPHVSVPAVLSFSLFLGRGSREARGTGRPCSKTASKRENPSHTQTTNFRFFSFPFSPQLRMYALNNPPSCFRNRNKRYFIMHIPPPSLLENIMSRYQIYFCGLSLPMIKSQQAKQTVSRCF